MRQYNKTHWSASGEVFFPCLLSDTELLPPVWSRNDRFMLRDVDVDVDLPARYFPVKLSERPWDDLLTNILSI